MAKDHVYKVRYSANGKTHEAKVRASSAAAAQDAVMKKYGNYHPQSVKRAKY